MDPVLLHLRVNHCPICLGVLATTAAVLAAVLRKDPVWKYAQITMFVAAVSAAAAQWTGERAETVLGGLDNLNEGIYDRMYDHQDSATLALWCMLTAGAAAAVSFWKPHAATRWIFLAAAIGGTVAVGITSKNGGEILHSIPPEKIRVKGE
jgi:hypothetical protein